VDQPLDAHGHAIDSRTAGAVLDVLSDALALRLVELHVGEIVQQVANFSTVH
jgi:hypothetical protein